MPTISIVDDDVWTRGGLRALIESLGFDAYTFDSAEQFLNSETLGQTACLITDIQMPGLSGLELQRLLRAQGYSIPVIFITAFPDERRRSNALDGGAIGFLRKPFEEQSLIDCLALAINPDRPSD